LVVMFCSVFRTCPVGYPDLAVKPSLLQDAENIANP
jgi:hypothetical protein